jgi:hypothetical protein
MGKLSAGLGHLFLVHVIGRHSIEGIWKSDHGFGPMFFKAEILKRFG